LPLPFDVAQKYQRLTGAIQAMPDPDKQTEGKEAKPSRLEEARRIIEVYAADLREIIQKLRRKMN